MVPCSLWADCPALYAIFSMNDASPRIDHSGQHILSCSTLAPCDQKKPGYTQRCPLSILPEREACVAQRANGGRKDTCMTRITGQMVVRARVLHPKFCPAALVIEVYHAYGARLSLLPR